MRRMAAGDAIPRGPAKQGACHARDPLTFQNGITSNSISAGAVETMMRNVNGALSEIQHHSRARDGAGMPSCFILR
jgi:hypothetical protein